MRNGTHRPWMHSGGDLTSSSALSPHRSLYQKGGARFYGVNSYLYPYIHNICIYKNIIYIYIDIDGWIYKACVP